MAELSSINAVANQINSSSLYFAAAQSASAQLAGQAKKAEKKEKSAFASRLSEHQEKAQLLSEGLPVEIAGMTQDEAIVFLKDAVDIAGDELKQHQNLEAMESYRKKVSQFMKYIVKINYNFITTREQKKLRSGRVIKPMYQIQIIDQKLNQLAAEMMILHGANLNLLAKLEEINGMIVDLLAE
ncbi:MAG: DUF327 family protein [Treponema sp.]|nr:DUF327 family protein [Treponema sp.]